MFRCTDVKKIYMLIRQKKGVNPQNRLDQLFTSKLFDLLKKQKNEVHKKVFAIHGDIEEPMLGIAEKDQQLLIEEVKNKDSDSHFTKVTHLLSG